MHVDVTENITQLSESESDKTKAIPVIPHTFFELLYFKRTVAL